MTAGKIVAMAGSVVDGLIVLLRAAEAFGFKLNLLLLLGASKTNS